MKTIRMYIVHSIFILMMASLSHQAWAQTLPRDDDNWQPYRIGPDAEVYTLHTNLASFPFHMYVGGAFTNFEGRPANHIVRFNTEFWESLGGGVDGSVFAIAANLYPWNGVFVGGQFLNAINPDGSMVSANNIAFWDNSRRKWFPVGNGVDGPVLALAPGGIGASTQLFAGGNFTRAHNGPVFNRIGKFDLYRSTWEPFGQGVASASTPIVRSIVVAPIPSVGNFVQIDLSLVYVGGRFTEATKASCRCGPVRPARQAKRCTPGALLIKREIKMRSALPGGNIWRGRRLLFFSAPPPSFTRAAAVVREIAGARGSTWMEEEYISNLAHPASGSRLQQPTRSFLIILAFVKLPICRSFVTCSGSRC